MLHESDKGKDVQMAKQQMTRIYSSWGDDSQEAEPRNVYIWGHQPHFAIDVKVTAESLFRQLDDTIVPDTFIVAINSERQSQFPPAVVEPDDHDFQPGDFNGILDFVAQQERISPGPSHEYPVGSKQGEMWAKEQERLAFRGRLGAAVKQILETSVSYDCPIVYVSPSRELGPYVVFSVLMIDRSKYDSYPMLRRMTRDRYSIVPSLIDAVAQTFVEACSTAILSSFAGEGYQTFPTTDSLLRAAGRSFMYTPFGACDAPDGVHGGFDTCNEISTLTYEKSVGRGRLILAKAGHESVCESLSFRNPPKLRNYRAVRKLLQLAGNNEGLVSDSVSVLGIGTVCSDYNATDEDLFCVEFVGHSKWQLTHNGIPLMRVEYGVPQLPKKRQQLRRFTETFSRVFPDASDKQQSNMTRIASAATELNHGAILIVAEKAAEEAVRYRSQSTIIDPRHLSPELLERASRIDGAVLASPDGICHAVGVILDGKTNEKGTADRGARFNSTVRYVVGAEFPCLGMVISDDGMVDIVPEYRPRISRNEIERRIEKLRQIVGETRVAQREMNKVTRWLDNHRFYLSEDQCRTVNELIALAEPKSDRSAAWCEYQPFERDSEMNDSYLHP